MEYDFKKIDEIFKNAEKNGRNFLYEHQVYKILEIMGINVPEFEFIPINEKIDTNKLNKFKSKKVVLKVASSEITHKTEAGGVRLNLKTEIIEDSIEEMKKQIPERYANWLIKNKNLASGYPEELLENKNELKKFISKSIAGFLVVEQIPYDSKFGNELMIGIKSDDAYGSVIMFGIGGTKVDFFNESFAPGKSFNIASADLLKDSEIDDFIKKPSVYKILSGELRGETKKIEDAKLTDIIKKLKYLKTYYSFTNPEAEWNITECEVNPYVISQNDLYPLDGLLKFEKNDYEKIKKPYQKIEQLLNPKTVGIVGVSGKRVTLGTVILLNLLKSGIPKEDIYLLHPKEDDIKGCKCYKSVDDIKKAIGDRKLDMFVVGVPAVAPPGRAADDVIEQLIDKDITDSVTIITSGFGEIEKGKEKSERIKKMFREAHKKSDGGPVANGPNTLGNIYYNIDTKITPRYKSSADGKGKQNCALICQSGAFMITRQSDLAGILNPPISISIGNQIDLTMSDYLKFLKDHKGIDVFGIYMEGFGKSDGLEFLKVSEEIVKNGKAVIAYKAGKTPEGKSAAKGHTAAAAGDYVVSKKLFEDAGIYVAEDFEEFQDMFKLFSLLSGTKLNYDKSIPEAAALSNAGFEKCSIGDNLYDENKIPYFKIAKKEPSTIAKLEKIYKDYKIADFIDIGEILDLSPIADDKAYAEIIQTLLEDKNVDAGVFSIVPETVMLTTLEGINNEDIKDENSIVQRLIKIKKQTQKPFIVPVESGKLYEPMRKVFQENDIPVFYYADKGVKIFGKYLRYRMKNRL